MVSPTGEIAPTSVTWKYYDGFCMGNDIMEGKMTLTEAKAKAQELPDCCGFVFRGKEGMPDEPTAVHFKSRWTNLQDAGGGMTACHMMKKKQEALMDYYSVEGNDFGLPGDTYHITLHIAGKWRTVTWKKVESKKAEPDKVFPLTGTYYITGSFNDWTFTEIPKTGPSTCSIDLKLPGPSWDKRQQSYPFQIVRNEDWGQVLYPTTPDAAKGKDASGLAGPDADSGGLCWVLEGMIGDTVKIEFQRVVTADSDKKSVSWRTV
jgi:hypothetical protein